MRILHAIGTVGATREAFAFAGKFFAAARCNLREPMTCIDYHCGHAVNARMQTTGRPASPTHDFDVPKTAPAALALARDWLEVGNLAEAAKWAAIAANLDEAEKRIKTA